MSRATPDDRRLHIHAHFAWAAAFWGSAKVAQEDSNYLLAPIGYYYAAFHVGFATICTNLDIQDESLKRMGHSQLKAYLEPLVPFFTLEKFAFLQDVREGINYLGAKSPIGKASIVRGHGFGFGSTDYFACVEKCRIQSAEVISDCHEVIERFAITSGINYPDLNSDWWIHEFLDDDLLRGVIPREDAGIRAIKLGFRTELPKLIMKDPKKPHHPTDSRRSN